MAKPVILTGLRANNDLTLGNYFGGILPIVDMAMTRSDDYQINLFVPDLHSFTTPIDHTKLQEQIWNNIRIFIAAGLPIDRENVYLYRQSYISAHSELSWILDCFAGVGELARMTEYKNKSAKVGQDRVSMGLFNYPVLMAADILLYDALYVPVGDDQRQHLEFTRVIAERCNNKFGELFVVPKSSEDQHKFFKRQALRIKDLHDPTKKMSKSDVSDKGVVFLNDDPSVSAKKIMSATTDDKECIRYNHQEQPGITNLIDLLALLTNRSAKEVTGEWEGNSKYREFKQAVADATIHFLTDFQTKLKHIEEEKVKNYLEISEKRVAQMATQKLHKIHQAVGLRR